MSQENVEVVRRVTDVMDAEGYEAALPAFLKAAHTDVEWRDDPAWPGSACYRGVEQVRQVISDRMDTLDFDQQTEDLISPPMVWTVREQAITRIEFFLDRAEAFSAVGPRG